MDQWTAVRTGVFGFMALSLGPSLVYAYQPDNEVAASKIALSLPARIEGWQATDPPPGYYRPSFKGPDIEVDKLYRNAAGQRVYVYVAYYAVQAQDKEAVYYANRVYDGEIWGLGSGTTRVLQTPVGRVRKSTIRSRSTAEKAVWQWYYVHGSRTSSDYSAKILNLWNILHGKPSIAAVVVSTDENRSSGRARATLTQFVSDAAEAIERAIDQVGK